MVHLELPNNWQDLATGYVLNNLSEEEAWIWSMLLQEYPQLHQEIQELDRAFNRLADVVPRHQPSADILSKIHSTIAAKHPQAHPLSSQSFQQSQHQVPIALSIPSRTTEGRQIHSQSSVKSLRHGPGQALSRLPLSRKTLSRKTLSRKTLSERSPCSRHMVQISRAILAGIIALLGFQLKHLQTQLQQTSTELQQANTQIKSLNRQIQQTESLTQYTRPVVQTLQEQGSLIYSLAGSKLANMASGRLMMSEEKVMIVVQNLPQLPEGKIYRLWAALPTKDVVYCGQFNNRNTEGMTIIQLTPSSNHCGKNPSQMIITLDAVTDPTTKRGSIVMQSKI